MTKVSVIIPLYNSARFLPSLFENIAQQTIAADLEFIFIDDYGSDDSLAAARLLAASSSLKCIFGATASNGGPGAARNVGLKMAGGEYVAFLDSDDRLDPAFCEKLYRAAAGATADLACCDAICHEGTQTRLLENPLFPDGPLSEKMRERIMRRLVTYLWTYVFRREFLLENHISFPAFRSAEDSCLVCCSWLSAKRVARVREPLYHYRVAPQSLSSRRDPTRWKQRLSSLRSFETYARTCGLYRQHRRLIRRLVIRKGWLLAVRDYLTNNLFK